MKVKIQRNQIHLSKEENVLFFNIQFPELSDTYTYGIRVALPIDKQKLKDAIYAVGQKAEAEFAKDEAVRAKFDQALGVPATDTYELDI